MNAFGNNPVSPGDGLKRELGRVWAHPPPGVDAYCAWHRHLFRRRQMRGFKPYTTRHIEIARGETSSQELEPTFSHSFSRGRLGLDLFDTVRHRDHPLDPSRKSRIPMRD
jgi:hypothetical protein